MAIETVTIFRADTGEAVKTLGDLRESIKALKQHLDEAEVGTKDYAETLVQLQTQQAALKNAMHDTTYESDSQADAFSRTAKQAKGLGTSYNALVRQMADLDQQFRNTEDAAERANLGEKIKAINEQLKEMDAARGKFGRNVGDYFNQFTAASKEIIKNLPSGLANIKHGLDDTTNSLALMGKQPILGIIGLLAPVISKIAEGLKENETAMGAVHKLGKALEPVAQFFEKILQKIADVISRVVDFVLELGERTGIEFSKIVGFATGVGNAILQFILTPVRETLAAIKGLGSAVKNLFKGDFKAAAAAAKEAGEGITQAFKQGLSFKQNFQLGQQAGEQFASGLKSKRKEARDAGRALAEEVQKGLQEVDLSKLDNTIDVTLKARVEAEKAAAKEEADLLKIIEEQNAQTAAEIGEIWDGYLADQEARRAAEEQAVQDRISGLYGLADAAASVFSTLADIEEENAENDKKGSVKAKALRTASAIIDTISGAIAAYMNTIKSIHNPAIAIPLGVVNAGTVLASGYAQIKKINAVNVGGSSGTAGAVVSAPAFASSVQQVRTVTGASEEDRLNRMAAKQRVYILASDLQAERNADRVRIAETAF